MATESWRWQDDSTSSFLAAATLPDESIVVAGTVESSSGDKEDFVAMRLNPVDGSFMWKWQEKSSEDDVIAGAAAGSDGSVVLSGFTLGNWTGVGGGREDYAAVKLNPDGEVVWRLQGGSGGGDGFFSVAVGGDESAFLGGTVSESFHLMKVDGDGNVAWEWMGDSGEQDQGIAVLFSGGDNSAVLAGTTGGDWAGAFTGGSSDFAAVKVDPDGLEKWRWQDGTEEADCVLSAVEAEDGSIIMSGWTTGSFGSSNAGKEDFVAIKLDADGTELWRWQDGTSGNDQIWASTMIGDGSVVMAGFTYGNWSGQNRGRGDFMAVKLDASDGSSEAWRWQDGTDGDDFIVAITSVSGGLMAFAGCTKPSSYRSRPGDVERGVVLMINTSLSPPRSRPLSPLLNVPPATIMTEKIVISAAAVALLALAFCRRRIRACRLRSVNSSVDVKSPGDDEVSVVAGRGGKHASAHSHVTE